VPGAAYRAFVMPLELTVVDSFTATPFAGNPAAIAVVDAFPDERRMQTVAAEMNLSETAFVVPRADGAYDLRWFTPTVEVDLCGHATLAAAAVLGGTADFHTRSGLLACRRGEDGWIAMDFPIDRPQELPQPPTLALGDVVWFGSGRTTLLAELADARAVREFAPDLAAIAALGVPLAVTAEGHQPGIDFVSRFFAPSAGIPEDPVTGSAHCMLAPYWAPRLGRATLVGAQLSPRGGTVRAVCRDERVEIAGEAATVATVRLLV
jgi:predicted PhzF superfamily epimerase YddE/YHI9